jgi:hypothetical protein
VVSVEVPEIVISTVESTSDELEEEDGTTGFTVVDVLNETSADEVG